MNARIGWHSSHRQHELALVDAVRPRAVACCLGAEDAVYRRELYAGYHAQREPMPTSCGAVDAPQTRLLAAFGWTSGYTTSSSDDLLWSYARSRPGQAGAR